MNKVKGAIFIRYNKQVCLMFICLLNYLVDAQNLTSKDSSIAKDVIERTSHFDVQYQKLRRAEDIFNKQPKEALALVEDVVVFTIDKQTLLYGIKKDSKDLNFLKGRAYELLGDFNIHNKTYSQALDNYLSAEYAYKRKGKQYISYKLIKNIAFSYRINKNYKESLEYYLHTEIKAKANNIYKDIIHAQNSIGELYYILGQKHLAESYHLNALDLALKYNYNIGIKESTLLIEKLETKIKENDALTDFDRHSREIKNAFGSNLEIREYRKYKDIEIKQDRINFENLPVFRDTINIGHIGKLRIDYTGFTEDVNRKNEINRSILELKDQIFVATNDKTYPELSQALYQLYRLYEKNEKPHLALESLKAYHAIQDSLYSLSPVVEVNFDEELKLVQTKLSYLEREKNLDLKTIEVLKKQQTLDQEAIKNVKERSLFLIISLILLCITVILFIRLNRSRKRANELLRLKGLQAQMNPHFIFNTLNSVNNFISKNDERSANRYISDFSKLMRQVLELAQEDLISLEKEIEMLSLYLKLEHLRFKDKFEYKIDVDESLDIQDISIPPMLVQPFIENAIWHGLRYKDKGGYLQVRISGHRSFCMISIEDNGIGRAKSAELKTKNQKNHKSTALKNIESRLSYIKRIFKKELEVDIIDKAEGEGTIVHIKLFK